MLSHDVRDRFILFFKLRYDPFMVHVVSVLAQLERRLHVSDINPEQDKNGLIVNQIPSIQT